jgi:hypothetical protein
MRISDNNLDGFLDTVTRKLNMFGGNMATINHYVDKGYTRMKFLREIAVRALRRQEIGLNQNPPQSRPIERKGGFDFAPSQSNLTKQLNSNIPLRDWIESIHVGIYPIVNAVK